MFNPSGSSDSQIALERADLERNRSIPIIQLLYLAYTPVRRFA